MTRAVLGLAAILTACAAAPEPLPTPPTPPTPPSPPSVNACPPPVPEPATLPRIIASDRLASLARDLESARVAERRRGDACAKVAHDLARWIARP